MKLIDVIREITKKNLPRDDSAKIYKYTNIAIDKIREAAKEGRAYTEFTLADFPGNQNVIIKLKEEGFEVEKSMICIGQDRLYKIRW